MTTEALVRGDEPMLTAQEMRLRVNRLQEVMTAVMIGPTKEKPEGVHFGIIPGTDKPTLYKAGAEKILMTFRISAVVKQIEDLGVPGEEARYRVTMQGQSPAGEVLGEGSGEASSNEEKYKWRRPVHPNEYERTDPERRREKFTRNGDTWKQVRTEPADVANTILKMAVKRALVAMTLVVTAASDVFSQDIEDLPEELREVATGEPQKPTVQQPARVQPGPQGEARVQSPANATANAVAAERGAFDPAQVYTLKRMWKPNPNKDYRFLELLGANAKHPFVVHVWDAATIALLEGHENQRIKITGQPSNFDAAPFQVKKAELVGGGREPGAEG